MSGGSVRFWFSCAPDSWLVFRVCKTADIPNALRDVRDGVLPIALVFGGDIPVEFLPAQFTQDAFHMGYTQTKRQVGRIGVAGLNDVFQMNADDAALKDFQPGDRIHAGARPVAHVGTDAETLVAVLDEREDVVWIPKFVVRFVGAFRMAVNARRNVVLLD